MKQFIATVLGTFVGLFLWFFLVFLIITLSGCSSTPHREYNSEDKQDPACYAKYGGISGYCDAIDDEDPNEIFKDNKMIYGGEGK